jgi:hypothetical protein
VCGPAFNDAPSYRAAEAPLGREVQREILTGQAAIGGRRTERKLLRWSVGHLRLPTNPAQMTSPGPSCQWRVGALLDDTPIL